HARAQIGDAVFRLTGRGPARDVLRHRRPLVGGELDARGLLLRGGGAHENQAAEGRSNPMLHAGLLLRVNVSRPGRFRPQPRPSRGGIAGALARKRAPCDWSARSATSSRVARCVAAVAANNWLPTNLEAPP